MWGLAVGNNTLSDVALYLALLGFATAVFLSWFIRDQHRHTPNIAAVTGYLLYAAGFGLLSAPTRFAFGGWVPVVYAFGALCLATLLPLTWILFVEYFGR